MATMGKFFPNKHHCTCCKGFFAMLQNFATKEIIGWKYVL
jgi:hypothetical protein